jgi:hydantoinase/carbamoylase family amidase
VTRLAWSRPHLEAIEWMSECFAEQGLTTVLDPAGNLIARWDAAGAKAAIGLGSHLDSVPEGGRFDGGLGVVGALRAIELLRERRFEPSRSVWAVAFMDEEGTRFGESMFGSRAFVGEDLGEFLSLEDNDGISVAAAMRAAGLDPAGVPTARGIDQMGAFLELHIEQGRVLEDAGVEIGVVTAIVGLLQAHVEIVGQSDHGGATPMPGRRDSLVAAARMIVALREWALGRPEMTATVGTISVGPGAYNVIPGVCRFSVDLRVPDCGQFADLSPRLEETLGAIAAEEMVQASITTTDLIPPAPLDSRLMALVEQAVKDEGASCMRMPSGAGHDTQVLARHIPSALVFVPSSNGISHSPLESTSPEHCELGARILARVVELADADLDLRTATAGGHGP